jgi:SAM-dependent methyltransferase
MPLHTQGQVDLRRLYETGVGRALGGFERILAELMYRIGLAPWDTGIAATELMDVVEGPSRREPGRALDLGCGTGRNSIYLAQQGWEVTGIDFVGHAIAEARRKASASGLSARFIEGDVTRLEELGIGGGYSLLLDFGCYHGVPTGRRNAYAAGVTRVAAPGALFLMVGIGKMGGLGMTADELQRRFRGWRLFSVTRLPEDFWRQFRLPDWAKRFGKNRLEIWQYQLEREALEGR